MKPLTSDWPSNQHATPAVCWRRLQDFRQPRLAAVTARAVADARVIDVIWRCRTVLEWAGRRLISQFASQQVRQESTCVQGCGAIEKAGGDDPPACKMNGDRRVDQALLRRRAMLSPSRAAPASRSEVGSGTARRVTTFSWLAVRSVIE